MEKKMYSLTYCYEGIDNYSNPFAITLAVSDDIEKLKKYMEERIAEDCRKPENEDEKWNDDCNYSILTKFELDVYLQHNAHSNLYTTYWIKPVEVL